MRNKEDDDVWGLEDDYKLSPKFTFDQSIRIEGFPLYFNRN